MPEGEVASQCLWVGNVDPEISQTEFKAVFEKYGPVQLIRLFPRSKCAFVTFQKPSHAIKALEMEGKQLGSMNLTLNVGKVSTAERQAQRQGQQQGGPKIEDGGCGMRDGARAREPTPHATHTNARRHAHATVIMWCPC